MRIMLKTCFLGLSIILVTSCQKIEDISLANIQSYSTEKTSIQPGITSNFNQWLNDNGYAAYDFAQYSLSGGSFGGKQNDNDAVVNDPVIFIHGNSDKALGAVTG